MTKEMRTKMLRHLLKVKDTVFYSYQAVLESLHAAQVDTPSPVELSPYLTLEDLSEVRMGADTYRIRSEAVSKALAWIELEQSLFERPVTWRNEVLGQVYAVGPVEYEAKFRPLTLRQLQHVDKDYDGYGVSMGCHVEPSRCAICDESKLREVTNAVIQAQAPAQACSEAKYPCPLTGGEVTAQFCATNGTHCTEICTMYPQGRARIDPQHSPVPITDIKGSDVNKRLFTLPVEDVTRRAPPQHEKVVPAPLRVPNMQILGKDSVAALKEVEQLEAKQGSELVSAQTRARMAGIDLNQIEAQLLLAAEASPPKIMNCYMKKMPEPHVRAGSFPDKDTAKNLRRWLESEIHDAKTFSVTDGDMETIDLNGAPLRPEDITKTMELLQKNRSHYYEKLICAGTPRHVDPMYKIEKIEPTLIKDRARTEAMVQHVKDIAARAEHGARCWRCGVVGPETQIGAQCTCHGWFMQNRIRPESWTELVSRVGSVDRALVEAGFAVWGSNNRIMPARIPAGSPLSIVSILDQDVDRTRRSAYVGKTCTLIEDATVHVVIGGRVLYHAYLDPTIWNRLDPIRLDSVELNMKLSQYADQVEAQITTILVEIVSRFIASKYAGPDPLRIVEERARLALAELPHDSSRRHDVERCCGATRSGYEGREARHHYASLLWDGIERAVEPRYVKRNCAVLRAARICLDMISSLPEL